MQRPFPAYTGREPFIFVSYAHRDAPKVYPELLWLHENGVNLWYDEGIRAGSVWRDQLAEKLEQSERVVFFATEESINSRDCLNELHFAMDDDKPILVVQFDELTLPTGLRFGLGSRQAIIASHYRHEAFREQLLDAVSRENVAETRSVEMPRQAAASMVIADFENRTEESVFDGTLEGVLANCLESVSEVEIFPRTQALDVARTLIEDEGLQTLGARTTVLVAFREGIEFVLSGSILRSKAGYRAELLVTNTFTRSESGESSALVIEAMDQSALLGEATRRAGSILDIIQENYSPDALSNEENITTSSIEAAHHYVMGQRAQQSWQFERAIQHFTRATDLDPHFGRAWSGLAAMYANIGDNQEAVRHYERSLANIDRMSPRERYRTRGGYYLMLRNHEKAVREYTQLLEEYPDDAAGLTNLPLAWLFGRDLRRAVESSDAGVARLPDNHLLKVNKALYLMYAGDFRESRDLARSLLDSMPDVGELTVVLAIAEILVEEDLDAAAGLYRSLTSKTGRNVLLGTAGLADLEIHRGHLGAAEAVIESSGLVPQHPLLAVIRAEIKTLRRDLAGARELLDTVDTKDFGVMFLQAVAYVYSGGIDRAREISRTLQGRLERDNRVHGAIVEALIDLQSGEAITALNRLESCNATLDTWLARLCMAHCYLEMDAFVEASGEIEQCERRAGEMVCVLLDDVPTLRFANRLLLLSARCKHGLGSGYAADAARRLLDLWDTPDMSRSPVVSELRHVAAAAHP